MGGVVLLVDPDVSYRNRLAQAIMAMGFRVETTLTPKSALKNWASQPILCVVSEMVFPRDDALTFCQGITQTDVAGFVFVAEEVEEGDLQRGLQAGADMVFSKSLDETTIAAYVLQLSRRLLAEPVVLATHQTIEDVTFMPHLQQVMYQDTVISLTNLEYDLFYYLAINRNKVVSRKELLAQLWQNELASETQERLVDSAVRHLRTKLKKAHLEACVVTVRKQGYRYVSHQGH